jgi:O-antigen ligase
MAFSLVYGAEHYVSDILLGWLYTVATLVAGRALMRWWAQRRAIRTSPAGRAEPAYSRADG